MKPVCRSNTGNPMLVSQIQKWLMPANRLVCVALITGALVMYQKYSNYQLLAETAEKTPCANNAFISRKFVSLTRITRHQPMAARTTSWRDYINLVLS
jgi:hypothetical protein